ncbi:hypothetical protein [Lusitaniella coriacea]|uniref:hypothetical protein n=1 Tax=Lusitaniella coriacea TaxID=1983105 RepID=UPI003CF00AD7
MLAPKNPLEAFTRSRTKIQYPSNQRSRTDLKLPCIRDRALDQSNIPHSRDRAQSRKTTIACFIG